MSNVLITGGAGFVGYHFSKKMADNHFTPIILDNLDDYYDIKYKLKRLSLLGIDTQKITYGNEVISKTYSNQKFIKGDICDQELVKDIFSKNEIEYVVHMAARSGARGSFSNPNDYIKDNIEGTANILNISTKHNIKHFVFTSSSSVYGNTSQDNENTIQLKPISLYGATKLSAEIISETYSRAKNLPVTVCRLFSVYGPLGRPDGFIFKCIESIKNEISIELYNNGEMWRDFIYIKDVSEILFRILLSKPENNFKVYDVGTGVATKITDIIHVLEKVLGKKANIKNVAGDKSESTIAKAHKELMFKEFDTQKMTDIERNLKDFLKEEKL